jgi:hypothetical protein
MENQKIEQSIMEFFSMVEKEVQKMEYGQMSISVQVSRGIPVPHTINIIKQKRTRYKIENRGECNG